MLEPKVGDFCLIKSYTCLIGQIVDSCGDYYKVKTELGDKCWYIIGKIKILTKEEKVGLL